MTTPAIPPRPVRSKPAPDPFPLQQHLITTQPDPINREAYARSPLNDLPDPRFHAEDSQHTLGSRPAPSSSSSSVKLPTIGHEGDEYASIDAASITSRVPEPEHTRSVPQDLHMHQPTAALPQSTAKSRVQTVTRTDATNNEGPADIDHHDTKSHALRARASFNRSAASLQASPSRPETSHDVDSDHDNDIGVRVPMYPNAGFVQAPSPSPLSAPNSAGFGSFHDAHVRHHHRRASSRQELSPPGSYGMHGHGYEPRDQFERAWYQKHPDELDKERHHVYDPGHAPTEMALSSQDLNKLVQHSAETGIGFATDRSAIGTPTEQVAHQASALYANAESPLRQTTSYEQKEPADERDLHIDDPSRVVGKYTGAGYDPPTEDLGPNGGNTFDRGGYISEKGLGVPILASDEVAKSPGGAFQLPAIEPERHVSQSDAYTSHDSSRPSSRPASATRDRPVSRPGSASRDLLRIMSSDKREGTPLEEIQEFEPLFPEDNEAVKTSSVKVVPQRPDALTRHHFPSQDIWEDTPNSASLTATVSSPPPQDEAPIRAKPRDDVAATFEHPDTESARKDHLDPGDRADFLPQSTREMARDMARTRYNRGLHDEVHARPGMTQRFPSSDVWEDSPDSAQLQAVVGSPSAETTPAQPLSLAESTKPSVPARPSSRGTDRTPPTVPERPSGTKSLLTKTTSLDSAPRTDAPPANFAKVKPAVPARPTGSKISALKASFMNDLNSRLQMGPVAPKKEEVAPTASDEKVAEKEEPLADSRKGRAKGPARRRPAGETAETNSKDVAPPGQMQKCSVCTAKVWFSVDVDGRLQVPGRDAMSHQDEPRHDAAGHGSTEKSEAPKYEHDPLEKGKTEQAEVGKATTEQVETEQQPIAQQEQGVAHAQFDKTVGALDGTDVPVVEDAEVKPSAVVEEAVERTSEV